MPDMLRIQIRSRRALIPRTCYQYGTHLTDMQYLPNLRVYPWEEGINSFIQKSPKTQTWQERSTESLIYSFTLVAMLYFVNYS